MKKCNKCLEVKPFYEFGKERRSKNGYKPRCKKCTNEYYNSIYSNFKENKIKKAKEYYIKNKEVILKKNKLYANQNKEKKHKYNKEYRLKNKEILNKKQNEYEKNKLKNNPHYRLIKNMRKLVYRTLLNKSKNTIELLGYNSNDLYKKLGRYPNENEAIDHKIPISWFIEYTDIKIINDLENLHILSKHENSVKNNKYSHIISKKYFDLIVKFIKPNHLKKIIYEK